MSDTTTPIPVDSAAIAAVFEGANLQYRIEEDSVRSGFNNAALICAIDDNYLIFEAIWRGTVPQDLASHLLYAVNEHNQTHFTPTLRFFETDENTLAVSAIRTLDITRDASAMQVEAFIISAIQATLEAFNYLETTFPSLKTWEEHNHAH